MIRSRLPRPAPGRALSAFLLLIALLLAGPPLVQAQERIQARSATMPAPQAITTGLEAMSNPPSNADAMLAARVAAINDHHLSGPPVQPPTSVLPEAQVAIPAPLDITPGGIRPLRNTAMTANNDMTSPVDEPSVATRGQEVLFTGNWYAAFSHDGGQTFTYVNPFDTFPSADGGFCCDQVAVYDPEHDLMAWYLQYIEQGGRNTGRLAVASGQDIADQRWRFYDFTAQDLGFSNEWLDYPDIAAGSDFLYLTSNVFDATSDTFARAVVLRLPLDALAQNQSFSYDFFDTTQFGSLRLAQGATDTMYIGTHGQFSNTLRVFAWPESGTTINSSDATIQTWSPPSRLNPAVAPGPDGRDWLGRLDGRITAGFASDEQVGFAWTARQDSDFPFPHVRVAILDPDDLTSVTAQPHIWSDDFAIAYPAAATNASGDVAFSVAFGGGSFHPSHQVLLLDDAATAGYSGLETTTGTSGPDRNVWGDYLTVRRHGSQPETWVATGFTLQGGAAAGNVEPRYVHFERGPTGGGALTLENLQPGVRLAPGDTTTVRASTSPGASVTFTSSDPDKATVAPATATADASGVAEATVTGQTRLRSTVTITAEAGGATASVPVDVPDLSLLGLLALLLAMAATTFWLTRG